MHFLITNKTPKIKAYLKRNKALHFSMNAKLRIFPTDLNA
jgi:hypothetical protein